MNKSHETSFFFFRFSAEKMPLSSKLRSYAGRQVIPKISLCMVLGFLASTAEGKKSFSFFFPARFHRSHSVMFLTCFAFPFCLGVKQAVRFVRDTPTVSLCKQKLSSNFKETKERKLICFRKKCVKNNRQLFLLF